MAKSVDDRGRGARMARREEGAYYLYVTEEQRSQSGWIGREGDRLSHSRALTTIDSCKPPPSPSRRLPRPRSRRSTPRAPRLAPGGPEPPCGFFLKARRV